MKEHVDMLVKHQTLKYQHFLVKIPRSPPHTSVRVCVCVCVCVCVFIHFNSFHGLHYLEA